MGWLDAWKQAEESRLLLPGANDLDLKEAAVRWEGGERLATYARVLRNEVGRRCHRAWGTGQGPVIFLRVDPEVCSNLEGFSLTTNGQGVEICGASERGVLFGVGRLLREMTMDWERSYATPFRCSCFCPADLDLLSYPDYPMRQHQIAYRPKTNSYDAFSPQQMRQEILDQALFGCNGIEVIPPGLDDAEQSPHFTVDWLEMLEVASAWCEALDLRVSIWFPAFQEEAEPQWRAVFSALRRLDSLFVPGGDPGGRPAEELFRIMERQVSFMKEQAFPRAEVWVSSQYGLGISIDLKLNRWVPRERLLEWFGQLDTPRVRGFLTGVVYGPWSAMPLPEFVGHVPEGYPVRNYPDLCHIASCEFQVDGWDPVFATTHLREGINPRPRAYARIIAEQAPLTCGCGCYSEGVNDDVNKHIWSMLHWGPDQRGPLQNPDQVLQACLQHFARFLCEQPRNADRLSSLIFRLEQHWSRPLDEELLTEVAETRRLFGQLEEEQNPFLQRNWHWNLLLFRAEYDAFLCARYSQEKALVEQALEALSARQLQKAREILDQPYQSLPAARAHEQDHSLSYRDGVMFAWGRLQRLAALLFEQIGYQSSLGYGGQHRQRGAFFDMAWIPLHDLQYWRRRCEEGELPPEETTQVLWHASFGEGLKVGETPIERVVPPYRKLEPGEDPTYFAHPLTEHLASDCDLTLKQLCEGRIPRSWRSWLVNIWPETARMEFRLPTVGWPRSGLVLEVTYLGQDLSRLGGDWAELERQVLPTRLWSGGSLVHDLLPPPPHTTVMRFPLPCHQGDELVLAWEPEEPAAVTVNNVPIPIAELKVVLGSC